MNRNTRGRKTLALGIVLLFFLGINLITIVSSDADINQDDGIWFDTFENENDIAKNVNCVVANGSVKLGEGSNVFNYNYKDDTEENGHEAFGTDITLISGEEELIKARNLATELIFDNTHYEAISALDSDVVLTEALYVDMELLEIVYTFTPLHHFRFKVDQRRENVENLLFNWWYGPSYTEANIDSIFLYVWNYSYPFVDRWIKVEEIIYNPNSNLNKITYSTSISSHIIGADGYIDFLVVAMPEIDGETCSLTSDYVNITLTTKHGYKAKGHIYSTLINPTDLSGWESIIWRGTGASDVSTIKMRIVNESGRIIDSLPGNVEGFTSSPVDISSLSSSITNIRINASLNSDDLSISPQLYSWAVTWQTENFRFKDKFSSELRIEKYFGVEISDGVTMSEYYSDWPIFGKDTSNTRAYEGYGPTEDDIEELYWETRKETVGGGFRSPVLSEGIIFLASPRDDKIYAYNSTSRTGDYIDSSESKYKVDCSVSITDEYVIVPTAQINASNKIYVLDKNNLENEIWSYPSTNSGDIIAFSSAPTASDEKIFVTSWNGMAWDTPLLSFLYNYKLLKGNNKIIALNLIDGSTIWEEDLPAGSFSTPAINNGVVYVGCDNMFGNNLFAFQEGSGLILWNVSVGICGRSSPVIHGDKLFIVVKNQSMFSLNADVKIVALNKHTGEEMWNQTIAENLFAFEALPKGLGFYNRMFTSTPAIFEDKLYVTSPDGSIHAFTTDGEALWTNDEIPSSIGVIPTYTCTSPVIASNYLYIGMPNGIIYALNPTNGNVAWEFNCELEDPELFSPTYILASPILADGILYVSVTEELSTYSGRIYAIGNFSPSQIGKVISNPIHLPVGNWWDEFIVKFTNNSKNSISFDILDENENVLLENVENEQAISDSSIINTNAIKLQARFSRQDRNDTPLLEYWGTNWTTEEIGPVFDNSSFDPDPSGWINTNTPVFSVRVHDTESGLDISTGKFIISYKNDNDKIVTSKGYSPEFSTDAVDGTNKKVKLTADISALDIASQIKDLISIEFSIKDLAGNKATYALDSFKKDTVNPTSSIKNVNSFLDAYNKPIGITANTNDDKSGVKSVGLYYRKPGDSEWTLYIDVDSPFSWSFDTENSSKIELCTIAKDKAGNIEDFPDEGEVIFVYDSTPPFKPILKDEYRFNKLPELSVKFEDDYKLKDVYYRINFHGLNEWTKINDEDIGKKSYTGKWTISNDDWEYMDETEYYIYFKLVDSTGNQYSIPSEDFFDALKIVKDLTASRSYLNVDDISEWSLNNEFTIIATPDEGNIEDIELHYRFSTDNENWGSWKKYGDQLTSSPFEWLFTAEDGSGYYQFKTVITDSAGNIGESEPDSVSFTILPLMAIILMIILIIILMIFTIFILKSIKIR